MDSLPKGSSRERSMSPPSSPQTSPLPASPPSSPVFEQHVIQHPSFASDVSITPPSSPFHPNNENDSPPQKVTKTWRVFTNVLSAGAQSIPLPSRSTSRLWEAKMQQVQKDRNDANVVASRSDASQEPLFGFSECMNDRVDVHLQPPICEQNELIESDSDVLFSSNSSLDVLSDLENPSSEDLRVVSDESSSECGSLFSDSDSHEEQELKLFEGSYKTVDEAVLDLFMDHLKNRETKASLKCHLNTFVKYIPIPYNMPKTVYALHKYLARHAPVISEKPECYCSDCFLYLGSQAGECEACKSENYKFFFSLNLQEQIRYYFEKCNLADVIDKYHQQRSSSPHQCIQDIVDGSEYLKNKVDGKYSLCLMWSTDGVQVSSSSNLSLYPVHAVICEVPPHLRHKFMLVSVVWCDYAKPPMFTLLAPFVNSLNELNESGGVQWKHPRDGVIHQSSVIAPVACADAPVRAALQNIQSHNSKYACNCCEQKTEKVPLTAEQEQAKYEGKRVTQPRRFLFREVPARLREHKRMLTQGRKAFLEGKESVKGVKGPSILEMLLYLNLATVVFPEYMHNICLGVVRHFLNLWLNVRGPWFIGNRIQELDLIMNRLRTPTTVGREPRPLSKFERWKASEIRSWMLFYSLPVLRGFLPPNYLQHWMLLVMAIFTLLKDKIYATDIEMAATLLNLFVRDVRNLYRDLDYTYNVHEMLHLPMSVERWGPLWATSAFLFENFNGILTRLIHGTKHIAKELCNNLITAYGIQGLQMKYVYDTPMNHLAIKLLSVCHLSQLRSSATEALTKNEIDMSKCTFFMRAKAGRQNFTSKLYKLEKKRNNYTVQFSSRELLLGYGEINFFFSYAADNHQAEALYAVISVFKIAHTKLFFYEPSRLKVAHVLPIEEPSEDTDELIVIPVADIQERVIRVLDYVCHQPNSYEARNL